MKTPSYELIYEKIVDALVEDGYVVLENALSDAVCKGLLQCAQADTSYKPAGISKSTQHHLDTKRRRDKIVWLDRSDSFREAYLDFADGLAHYLNRTLYLGLHYYEAHFAKYEIGDFYEKHYDTFKHSKNRVVTTVYYLNESWKEEDGGALILYDDCKAEQKTILPTANTLVVFLSEKFPHEVLPAKKTRYSIAGWFRVDKQ